MTITATHLGASAGAGARTVSGFSITAGDSLVVVCAERDASESVVTAPSGGAGSSTTELHSSTTGAFSAYVWRVDNCASGLTSVSAQVGTGTQTMSVYRIHGHTGTLTFVASDHDEDNISTATSSGDLGTDSLATTGSTDKTAVAFGVGDRSFDGESATDSFVSDDQQDNSHIEIAAFSRDFTGAVTLTPDFTTTSSDENWSCIVVYEDVTAGGISGSGTPTESADTSVASGTVTSSGASITGSGTPSESADTAVGAGNQSANLTGSGTPAESADTSVGSGVLSGNRTGTVAATEGADASVGIGVVAVQIAGSGAMTEAPDTVVAIGVRNTSITGTMAVTEGADYTQSEGKGGYLPGLRGDETEEELRRIRNARYRSLVA